MLKLGEIVRVWAGAVFLAVLAYQAWVLPPKIAATLHDVGESVALLPDKVTPPVLALVEKQATALQTTLDGRLGSIQNRTLEIVDYGVRGALGRVDDTLKVVDTRTGEALGTMDRGVGEALGALGPVLVNTAALVKDVQDSWDSNYDDVVGLLDSATVATTQLAQASRTFNLKFPEMVGTFQQSNSQVAGIATDFHDMVHEVDQRFFHPPPRTFGQKVVAGFKDTVFVGTGLARVVK